MLGYTSNRWRKAWQTSWPQTPTSLQLRGRKPELTFERAVGYTTNQVNNNPSWKIGALELRERETIAGREVWFRIQFRRQAVCSYTSVYRSGPLGLINPVIFLCVQHAFLYILCFGPQKKCSSCSYEYDKIMTLFCVHLTHFPFLYFLWKSWMWIEAWYFIFSSSIQSLTKGMQSCVTCGRCST